MVTDMAMVTAAGMAITVADIITDGIADAATGGTTIAIGERCAEAASSCPPLRP